MLATACELNSTYTPVPTVVEPGLAYGEPCKPPCWYGMVPGQSTREDAEQAIRLLRDTQWPEDISGGEPCGYSIEPGSIRVTMENEVVSAINGQVTFYYPVGTMIEQFGEPEALYVVSPSHNTATGSCDEWEPPSPGAHILRTPIHVLYPTQDLWFMLLVPVNGLGLICPEMRISAYTYYPGQTVEEALNSDALAGTVLKDIPKRT